MIKEAVFKKSLALAFRLIIESFKEKDLELAVQIPEVEINLERHFGEAIGWAENVDIKDSAKSKLTEKIYVPLDVFLFPRKLQLEDEGPIQSQPITEILSGTSENLILEGQPGAGKTTSMKWLCSRLLRDQNFLADRYRVPIVIRFRHLDGANSSGRTLPLRSDIVTYALWHVLGLKADFDSRKEPTETLRQQLSRHAVSTAIDALEALVILDGFDEIADAEKQRATVADLNYYAENLKKSKFVLTTRTGDFGYRLANTRNFEFAPLNEQQTKQFIKRWLEDESRADTLFSQIQASPFSDTALRPLTLAHLCAIFERSGRIPSKPKTVYRKVVQLLLEEWDEQRGVDRPSQYAAFEIDRRAEFLAHLAYQLTVSFNSVEFSQQEMEIVYRKICGNFDLPPNSARKVVAELESHHGLFLECGYQKFQFAHKSIQEFLTAEYLVRLPKIPQGPIISLLPNEMAIATSISSNPSLYLRSLAFDVISQQILPREFFEKFITRLVQEKPEFTSHREVFLALAEIYSKYAEYGLYDRKGQMQLFGHDNVFSVFEEFIALVAKRNSDEIITKNYFSTKVWSLADGSRIVELKKVGGTETASFPSKLLIREKFLPENFGQSNKFPF